MGLHCATRVSPRFDAAGRIVFARLILFALFALPSGIVVSAEKATGAAEFRSGVRPILENYCYDCHADGANKGGVAFDEFKSDEAIVQNRELWWKAMKNLRAGIMPPAKKPQPSAEQKELIAHWIKSAVFEIDPRDPDPGRVTVRRLNRVEYRNTIKDLLGVDFDTQEEFPPDDTGYGFDNIGDVLTLPPMLLEKYVDAAKKIVAEAVPTEPGTVRERTITGQRFLPKGGDGPLSLSFYAPAAVSNTFTAQFAGHYQLTLNLMVNEHFVDNVVDHNRCRLIFETDGKELWSQEFSWAGGESFHYVLDQDWAPGGHQLVFALEPLTPHEEQTRTLTLQISSLQMRGPMAKEYWVKPANYERYFPKPVPDAVAARREYARELLNRFAQRAFRHPVDAHTVERLVALAESDYSLPGKTFESGIAEAMVAVLASPRFLFREEGFEAGDGKDLHPFVDEYALASRLSYFFWSSMPDDELLGLAAAGNLRKNLSAQVARLLADPRSKALVKEFTGQWLRARDVDSIAIESRSVLAREEKFDPERERRRERFHELRDRPEDSLSAAEKAELDGLRSSFIKSFGRSQRAELNSELRRAMRLETEKVFDYVLREDRSVLEWIDSDYTFLNERLARHYGITNVFGPEMRRVTLPPDSPRGGLLTEGTALVVTSNPTRTSPVKRGLFILDNILGTPPPPPPPNIPPLEDAAKGKGHALSLRETLAIHRENPMCSSCHNRMDPLGLAFENFNALGMWRNAEYGEPIDATGRLITGEAFTNVLELKKIVVKNHYKDFYRTLAEKLLTYALGRGLEYYDVETVDQIVNRLEKSGGRPSALIAGVVESAPFQKTRRTGTQTASADKITEEAALEARASVAAHP